MLGRVFLYVFRPHTKSCLDWDSWASYDMPLQHTCWRLLMLTRQHSVRVTKQPKYSRLCRQEAGSVYHD